MSIVLAGQSPVVSTVPASKDLPKPIVEKRSRDYLHRKCPQCGQKCSRNTRGRRRLHDIGDLRSGRPRVLSLVYSVHHCERCKLYFSADTADLAPQKGLYTHRVMSLALRVVLEDGLPYRTASWHLWRDHRVFVPFATVQNWVEAEGEKKTDPVA